MHRSILIAVATVLLITPVTSSASSSGVTRRSQLNTAGCGTGTCHGAMPSDQVVVSVGQAVDGKIMVEPDSKTDLSLVIANAQMKAAGTNISINTELNGTTAAGILSVGFGASLRSTQGQLTHITPKAAVNGRVEFTFSWTAPTEEGTYYLHAAANAVNGNGVPSGDLWTWLEPVEIVVSAFVSVQEKFAAASAAGISPVPAHSSVMITAPVTAGEPLTVQIMDATGSVVRIDRATSNTDHFVYVWDGRTTAGSQAPTGVYTVAVMGERRIHTGRAVIVR